MPTFHLTLSELLINISDIEDAMSDGPYKSLPLKPHWKKVAKQAERAAFAPEQVCVQLQDALLRELQKSSIESVRKALRSSPQQTIFSDHADTATVLLEQLRPQYPGSAANTFLIDAAIEAVQSGLTGDEACLVAIQRASDAISQSHLRSIEEHYLRNASSKQTQFVRERLHEANDLCDHTTIANTFLAPDRSSQKSHSTQYKGVDEGPSLP